MQHHHVLLSVKSSDKLTKSMGVQEAVTATVNGMQGCLKLVMGVRCRG